MYTCLFSSSPRPFAPLGLSPGTLRLHLDEKRIAGAASKRESRSGNRGRTWSTSDEKSLARARPDAFWRLLRQLRIPDWCGNRQSESSAEVETDAMYRRTYPASVRKREMLLLLLHYSFGRHQRRSINSVSSCCRRMARRFTKDIPLLALSDILPQDRATVADVTRAESRDVEIRLALVPRIAAGLVRGTEISRL